MGKRYNRIKKLVREDRTPYTGTRDFDGGWRKKILSESDWTPIAGPIANSTSQTFVHSTGATTTVSGLGGVETTPSTVTIDAFGDRFDVPAPEYGQYGMQGYTPPLGKNVMRRNAEQKKARLAELDAKLNKLSLEPHKIQQDFYDKWNKIKKALPPMPKSLGQYMRLDPVKALASRNLNAEERDYLKALAKYEKDFESAKKNDLGKKLDTITKEREALEKEYDYLLGMTPDVNSQLDASQEFAQKVGADTIMNARVQSGEFTPEQQAAIDAWNAKLRAMMDKHQKEWDALGRGYTKKQEMALANKQAAEINPLWDAEPKFDTPQKVKPAPSFAEISPEDEQFIKNLSVTPHMVNLFSPGSGIAGTLALQYAKGDMTPMTRSPGADFDKGVLNMIDAALTRGITPGSVSDRAYSGDTVKAMRQAPVRASIGQFNYEINSSGLKVLDRFNFNDNKSVGILKMIPRMQGIANRLVDIGNKRAINNGQNPTSDNYGIPIDYTIPWSKVPAQLQNKLDPTSTVIPTTWRKIKKRRLGKPNS